MNDHTEQTALTGYRFLDPEGETAPLQTSGSNLAVDYYPSIDDLVHITRTNQKAYKLTSYGKSAVVGFLLLNASGMPAVLFYFDRLAAALLVCAVNLIFSAFVLPKILVTDFRRFFRTIHGDIENEIVRVELSEEGIICRAKGDVSFHRWRNIKRIEESNEAIYFFLTGTGFAVRKSGFAYEQEKERFVSFARDHVRPSPSNDVANGS